MMNCMHSICIGCRSVTFSGVDHGRLVTLSTSMLLRRPYKVQLYPVYNTRSG